MNESHNINKYDGQNFGRNWILKEDVELKN